MNINEVKPENESQRPNCGTLDLKFRLLGVLPLIFFFAQLIHYWRGGGLANMLWMCNVGNLALAIGLFTAHRELIRVSSIWMIPGLVVWFVYVFLPSGILLTSTMAHLGGFAVALIVLRKVGVDRVAWLYAFIWYLLMQLISRFTTAPDANVNLAHRVYYGWESVFGSFWKFWLVLTVVVAIGLWTIGRVLNLMWPPREEQTATSG